MRAALILTLTALSAAPAAAQCLTAGTTAKCVSIGPVLTGAGGIQFLHAPASPAPFGIGEKLPESYPVLTNTQYYGLPPVQNGWLYYKAEGRLYRVDRVSREILGDATAEANKAFGG